MRLVTKADDEMYSAIKMSIKISGRNKMGNHFKSKIEAGDKPEDNWFYYALNAWELMNDSSLSRQKHEFLVEALEGFQKARSTLEKHWPAIFFGSLIRIMMSGDDVDEMCIYLLPTDYTLEDAYKDQERLLTYQNEVKPEPYFFSTYACIALRMIEMKEIKKAKNLIKEGLIRIPPEKSPYLSSFLNIPVIMLYNKLLALKHKKAALYVRKRYNEMFPNNRI